MSGGFGWGTYVAESRFSAFGQPLLMDLGTTYGAVVSYQWDDVTNRLNHIALDREGVSGTDLASSYRYDDAGNVTSVSDRPTNSVLSGAAKQDNQCFGYDGLRRLTLAWTALSSNDCGLTASQITPAKVGGAAAYWTEYEYDALGNRTRKIDHAVDGTAGTTTTAYQHGAGAAGPHAVTSTTVSIDGAAATASGSFAYGAGGNQTSRQVPDLPVQQMSWDAEGELAEVTVQGTDGEVADGEASFVYDADGERLVRTDAGGTTVYLPGGQELRVDSSGEVSVTRHYGFAGQTVAVRTETGLGGVTSLVNDAHGTTLAAVPNTRWSASSVQKMYTDPFGAARGASSAATVPGDRQFLGKTRDDATGLTLLGARYYDEWLGRFISVDPQLDPGTPAQFNAYVYAGNNPLTWADPWGLSWLSKAWGKTKSFVKKHQAEIVGAVVGTVVTAGCLAATGGAGSIGCLAAGGAAGGAATNLWKTKVQKTQKFSWGSLARDTFVGGAVGAVTGGLGRVLAPVARKVVASVTSATRSVAPRAVSALRSTASTGSSGGRAAAGSSSRGAAAAKPSGSAGRSAPSCSTGNSFVPGTLVLLADGTSKPIEDVQLGDRVLAASEDSGEVSEGREVTRLITGSGSKTLVTVSLTDTDGEVQQIVATDKHPFWVPERQTWVDAIDLRSGDWLQTAAGTWVQVDAIDVDRQAATVHNLTVAVDHTYYVLTGTTPILVHNCGNAQALADRASEIHGQAGSEIAMSKSTVAVVSAQTPKGVVHVVAAGGRGLNNAQKGMLGGVEVPARNILGTHAEQNALLFINEMGWSPIAGGASRSVCSEVCAPLIRAGGGRITGRIFQSESGTKVRTFEW